MEAGATGRMVLGTPAGRKGAGINKLVQQNNMYTGDCKSKHLFLHPDKNNLNFSKQKEMFSAVKSATGSHVAINMTTFVAFDATKPIKQIP